MESIRDTVRHLQAQKLHSESQSQKACDGPLQHVEVESLQQRLETSEQSLQQLQRHVMGLEEKLSSSASSIKEIEGRASLTTRLVVKWAARLENTFPHQESVSDTALTKAASEDDVSVEAITGGMPSRESSRTAAGSKECGEGNGLGGRDSIEDIIDQLQRTAQQLQAEHTALSERLGAVEGRVGGREQELHNPCKVDSTTQKLLAECDALWKCLSAIESRVAEQGQCQNTVLGDRATEPYHGDVGAFEEFWPCGPRIKGDDSLEPRARLQNLAGLVSSSLDEHEAPACTSSQSPPCCDDGTVKAVRVFPDIQLGF